MRALLAAALLSIAACALPSGGYEPSLDAAPDATPDTPDGGGGFLLVVPDSELTIGEGQIGSFTVALSEAPPAPITVTITAADAERLGVPSQLSIDNDNWSTPQSITVTALSDVDAAPDDVIITLSAPGAADDVDVTVHVTDDDTLAIRTGASSIQITEGMQGVVKVRLTAAPPGDTTVAVALTPAQPLVASVAPPSLMFTAATWDVEQDVIITAEQDLDVAGATFTLALTDQGGAQAASVDVQIIDDDQVAIVPMPAALGTIDEGGAPVSLGISLTRDPGGPVRVTLAPTLAGKVTLTPGFVDFDSSSWNVVQSVQVSGAQDDDTRDDPLELRLTSPPLEERRVSVTVRDNDVPTLEASATQVTVMEGNTIMLGVRLAFDPLGTVTVSPSIDNPTVATILGAGLTFDSSNYHDYQQVMIRAEHDLDLATDDTFVTLQAPLLNATLSVPLHKTDDDQQVIETSAPAVTLAENAMTTFDVRLRFRPNGAVAVGVAVPPPGAHATTSPTSVPFTTGDFNDWHTVTVHGVRDPDLVPDTVPITLSGAAAPSPTTVTATVTDVDVQAIQASTAALTVAEGANGTFTVRLAFQPTAPVRVTVVSNNTLVATVTPAMIDFDAANYATPVTVTVTGAEDANAVVDSTSITLHSTTAGIPDRTVAITATDNDLQGLQVTATSISVTEGSTMMLGVRLRQDPVGPVTVSAASLDSAVIGLIGTTSFSFNSGNYSSYQYVTVDALQDNDLATQTGTVRFASVSPALMADVTVTKPDEDVQAIDTTVSSVTVLEGATAQFGVRLRYEPAGSVTVQVASADGAKATTSGNLTFGPGDYATFQTVTVTGTPDDNLTGETVAINLTSPGNAPPRAVNATVNDDDTQAILGAPASISLTEGQQTTVNVRLRFQPSTPTVTVTVGATPSGVVTTSGNLTFTSSNWASTQPITITAIDDVDLIDDSTTLSIGGAGASTVTVPIGVDDTDTLTIVPSTTSLTVPESGTGSFTVALSNQPNADVTVTLGVSPTGIATLSRSTITFTTVNWSTAVGVTVTPIADPDNASESTTVTLSSGGVTPNATVGITVNDTTVVSKAGWPTSFLPTTGSYSGNTVWAFKVTTAGTGTWTLDTLGLIAGVAGNQVKFALYTHNPSTDKPDTLITSTTAAAVAAGENAYAVSPAATIGGSSIYWIAFAVSGSVPLGDGGAGNQARRCQRATFGFADAWTATFGSSTCSNVNAVNVIATMHQ